MAIISSFSDRAPRQQGTPAARCAVAGCGGIVVRHSLGCGLAHFRCVRCLARYAPPHTAAASRRGQRRRPSRFLHDLLTWREED